MKVQLVFAPSKERSKLSDLVERVYPPLGILYIAGYLRKHMPELEIRATDGILVGWDTTVSEISAYSPDVVFISYITPCATGAYALGERIKDICPGTVVVFGGPHATALPAEPFARSRADFVAVGEGEETSLELVRALASGKKEFGDIDGLYWMKEGKVVINRPRQFIRDIDRIPFPARDLLDIKEYKGWVVHKKTPETTILFSRGCPFDCTFCTNAVWKSARPWLRLRSPEKIVDEMEQLKGIGIREVFDNSDEFNCDPRHAMAVCQEMIKRKIDMPWKAQVRASPFSDDLARAMADAGCWYVHIGIESGNERTLKGVRKMITLEQVKNACKILKKYNIKVMGLLMLLNVWEEDGKLAYEGVKETMKTLEFARRMIDEKLLDYVSSSITTPYPGSELFRIASKHGLIDKELTDDWSKWLTEEMFIMKVPGVTIKEARDLYFKGSLLRSYCYLRSGNWSLKEVPIFFDKFVRAALLKLQGPRRQ